MMSVVPKGDVAGKGPRIRKDIIDKVNEYKYKHAQYKMLEKELKKLREEIEPYMLERNISEIVDEMGQGIVLQDRKSPLLTTRYTAYDIDDLLMVLDPKIAAECIAEVVDGDIVEAKVLLGEIPSDIYELKQYNMIKSFVTK